MASRVVEEYYQQQQQQQQQHLSMSMPINALIGFRFNPTDIELIEGYLKKRISSSSSLLPEADGFIVDFDIYSCNPWELPRHHFRYPSQQREMYFFTPTRPSNSSSKSSSSSSRCARTAGCGVWHGNGQDHRIVKNGVVIGHTTSFKFEMIEPAAGDAGAEREKGSNKRSNNNSNSNSRRKTDWLMHEYRLTSTHALVLCKIYENKTTAAAASCRKQQQDQDQDQEEQQPVSAAAMPSLIVQAYSDAPDHIIQVPNLMMQQQQYQQHLLTKKRRRVEMEEEPAIILPASSSEITFMASAALPLPAWQQQQQQQQEEDANCADFSDSLEQQLLEQDSDFANSLEQQLLEQDAGFAEQQLSEQDAYFANSLEQVPARSMMPDEDTLFSSLQELTSLPSLEEQQEVANFADFANSLEQQVLEQVPARSMMPDEATLLSSLQNMPELPSLPSLEEQQEGNMDSLLSQISFDDELGSLPPLDFTIPEDVISMTADEFLSGLDCPF